MAPTETTTGGGGEAVAMAHGGCRCPSSNELGAAQLPTAASGSGNGAMGGVDARAQVGSVPPSQQQQAVAVAVAVAHGGCRCPSSNELGAAQITTTGSGSGSGSGERRHGQRVPSRTRQRRHQQRHRREHEQQQLDSGGGKGQQQIRRPRMSTKPHAAHSRVCSPTGNGTVYHLLGMR